jgi:hypothetical protein
MSIVPRERNLFIFAVGILLDGRIAEAVGRKTVQKSYRNRMGN